MPTCDTSRVCLVGVASPHIMSPNFPGPGSRDLGCKERPSRQGDCPDTAVTRPSLLVQVLSPTPAPAPFNTASSTATFTLLHVARAGHPPATEPPGPQSSADVECPRDRWLCLDRSPVTDRSQEPLGMQAPRAAPSHPHHDARCLPNTATKLPRSRPEAAQPWGARGQTCLSGRHSPQARDPHTACRRGGQHRCRLL